MSDEHLLIGRGSKEDEMSLCLATRDGWFIPNERSQEMPPQRMEAALAIWKRECPGAEVRSLSAIYNCVGMVFASRRTCVDPCYVMEILKKDGYSLVPKWSEAQIGDVIVYKNEKDVVEHVGIIVEIDRNMYTGETGFGVMSQWGRDGEYFHPHDHVPTIYGKPAEIWSERRIIV